jgi:hypothetical protein
VLVFSLPDRVPPARQNASVTDLSPDSVRDTIGLPLSDQELGALLDWYTSLSRAIEKFPEAELKAVEPPLRSTPGPTA